MSNIDRRTFVKRAGLGAAALAGGMPAFIPRLGEAADAIKIGVIEPYTGTYAFPGENETRGIEMAVDAWNKRGGVMGRKIEIVKEDDAANPQQAAQKARKLVNQDKCVSLVGTVSSGSSISVSGAAKDMGVVFMATGGHTDDVTGKNCSWNTFRVCHSTWMEAHATASTLMKKFGKKFYFITPDYAFGRSLQVAFEDVLKKNGGSVAGLDYTPLGTTDFSSYLTKVEPAKPDALIVIVQGDDFTNCMKQANQFGLLKKIPVGGPQAELEPLWGLPPEARVGFWGIEWYYKSDKCLGVGNAAAHSFIGEYNRRYMKKGDNKATPPTARECFGYVGMDRLLHAMSEAKSTDSVKVAKQLEGEKFTTIFAGSSYFRREDHQLMWPMWVAELRPNGSPGDPSDIFNVQDIHPADQIEQSVAEKSKICKIAYPT
ncbi:MAG: ABC transporter substrate-binding protein [Candidatus Eremiobacteraeota bacterium]|nr:ABC transporter substrate-binding protein [Candidatus Eremiobacteraeota bacterium]